jgi:hypothetical protein
MGTLRAGMRAVTVAIVSIGLFAIGCAERRPRVVPTSEPAPPSHDDAPPAPPKPPPDTASKVTAARVIVTGVLLRRGAEIEICPGESVAPCPGIRVQGKVEDAWLSDNEKISVWRLSGSFDGTTLVLDAPAQPTTSTSEPNFKNGCPELQKPKKGAVNPDLELMRTVERLVQEAGERVAGSWWDRERQTMVISVTGDPSGLRQSAAKLAPGARICVQGQARNSEAELERKRAKADEILRKHGVVWSGSGGDVTRNEIVYDAEAIDPATLAELARETGDAIRVVAFIELLEHGLEQMPMPAARGDLALATKKSRSAGGMAALGQFKVRYDRVQRCVYFDANEERMLPVWPFGYWATSSPLVIYDYDGNVVAKEGDAIELGGGMVDIEHAGADNSCGAKQAWITSSDGRVR